MRHDLLPGRHRARALPALRKSAVPGVLLLPHVGRSEGSRSALCGSCFGFLVDAWETETLEDAAADTLHSAASEDAALKDAAIKDAALKDAAREDAPRSAVPLSRRPRLTRGQILGYHERPRPAAGDGGPAALGGPHRHDPGGGIWGRRPHPAPAKPQRGAGAVRVIHLRRLRVVLPRIHAETAVERRSLEMADGTAVFDVRPASFVIERTPSGRTDVRGGAQTVFVRDTASGMALLESTAAPGRRSLPRSTQPPAPEAAEAAEGPRAAHTAQRRPEQLSFRFTKSAGQFATDLH